MRSRFQTKPAGINLRDGIVVDTRFDAKRPGRVRLALLKPSCNVIQIVGYHNHPTIDNTREFAGIL